MASARRRGRVEFAALTLGPITRSRLAPDGRAGSIRCRAGAPQQAGPLRSTSSPRWLSSTRPTAPLDTWPCVDGPPEYRGDLDRYRTFIRVPIRAAESGTVFGMLTVDAPKPGALSPGDVTLADLVAAEMSAAFAIAAG